MTWTQGQIDEAAKRSQEEFRSGSNQDGVWHRIVLAAQLPIAPVTDSEWREAAGNSGVVTRREVDHIIIARRNAPPKPDLRERIVAELRGRSQYFIGELADRILAIVKEQQP